jgi:hypothetical protein
LDDQAELDHRLPPWTTTETRAPSPPECWIPMKLHSRRSVARVSLPRGTRRLRWRNARSRTGRPARVPTTRASAFAIAWRSRSAAPCAWGAIRRGAGARVVRFARRMDSARRASGPSGGVRCRPLLSSGRTRTIRAPGGRSGVGWSARRGPRARCRRGPRRSATLPRAALGPVGDRRPCRRAVPGCRGRRQPGRWRWRTRWWSVVRGVVRRAGAAAWKVFDGWVRSASC